MNEAELPYLTPEGKVKLEEELEQLSGAGRRDVAERLRFAKDLGDISESGEFEDAKRAQEQLERRIAKIGDILSNHVLLDGEAGAGNGTVQIGSHVTVRDDGLEDSYELVGFAEANPREGKISYESPLGAALLGASVGDTVSFDAPSGTRSLEILTIE